MAELTTSVRPLPGTSAGVIDLEGDVTGAAEDALMEAYTEVAKSAQNIILNFSKLVYMNSTGIGLLVTLLIRTKRSKQRIIAVGLNEHYQQIFNLTRLDEAIDIFGTEADALAAL